MRTQVVIVDNGGANIASLGFALDRLNSGYTVSANPEAIRAASHVILPGVGAAADSMNRLRSARLVNVIRSLRRPVLGICLGMQLLFESSEESDTPCLGILPGSAKRLSATATNPVPNMGWCRVRTVCEHPLFDGVDSSPWFYFLHSYAIEAAGSCIATADHQSSFAAAVARDNFVATQFHPEKSAAAGARVLRNFLGMSA